MRKLFIVLYQEIDVDDGTEETADWSLEEIQREAIEDFGSRRGVSKLLRNYLGEIPQGERYRMRVYSSTGDGELNPSEFLEEGNLVYCGGYDTSFPS